MSAVTASCGMRARSSAGAVLAADYLARKPLRWGNAKLRRLLASLLDGCGGVASRLWRSLAWSEGLGMAVARRGDPTLKKFTTQMLNRHASYLGRVSLVWTELHETMASAFAALVSPDAPTLAWAIWNSVGNDRTLRGMLKAAALWRLPKEDVRCAELCWALDQMDSLENKRNDALHSPYTMVIESGAIRLISNHFRGNKRALNLAEKDLAKELKSYEKNIWAITRYVAAISAAIDRSAGSRNALLSPAPIILPPRPALTRPAHGRARKRPAPRTKRRTTPQSSGE
jgi:hypothetical protein